MLGGSPATFATPGIRFRVDSADPALHAAVNELLAPLQARDTGPAEAVYGLARNAAGCTLSIDGEPAVSFSGDDTVLNALVWDVHQRTAIGARHLLRLHAAAMQSPAGAVIAVGPSGAGKSTLCAALVRRGHGYLTDDLACLLPPTLDVVPYPKPLALQTEHGERLVAPQALGGVGEGAGAALVLLIGHGPGLRAESRRLRPVDAMARLVRHSCGLDDDPGGALDALNRLVHAVPCLELTSTTPAEAADLATQAIAAVGRAPAA